MGVFVFIEEEKIAWKELAWKELLEAATGEGFGGISILVRTRESEDRKKYMDNIKYIWSFADNGSQIPEYNRERMRKVQGPMVYKVRVNLGLRCSWAVSIIMYKGKSILDSSRFKEDSVTKDIRVWKALVLAVTWDKQTINTLYENEIHIRNL